MVKMSGEQRLAAQKANATQHLLSALHELEVRPTEPTGGLLGVFLGSRAMRDKDMDRAAAKVREALNLIAPPVEPPVDQDRSETGQPRPLQGLRPGE